MKASFFVVLLILFGTRGMAQAPSTTAATQTYSSDIGFSYSLPADWEVVDMSAALKAEQERTKAAEGSDQEKRGVGCMQIAMTAHHGTPASMIMAMALPTSCIGSEMSEKDLPGFGMGASQGIQQQFDLGEPVVATYSLGSHSAWIARFAATLKDSSHRPYTVETVCALLKKGSVCWMVLAADDDALATFEHGFATLDGETPVPLVPADVFVKGQQ
jgi:hypothetical protein